MLWYHYHYYYQLPLLSASAQGVMYFHLLPSFSGKTSNINLNMTVLSTTALNPTEGTVFVTDLYIYSVRFSY